MRVVPGIAQDGRTNGVQVMMGWESRPRCDEKAEKPERLHSKERRTTHWDSMAHPP
jgi:hypothetical protein